MSEIVRKQAELLARKRADKTPLAEELKQAEEALSVTPEFLRVKKAKENLATLKSEDSEALTALRASMITADSADEPIPACGKVINKTVVTVTDVDVFKKWASEKDLLSLLSPIMAEVKKVAPTLKPAGVEIKTVKHAQVSSNLDAFLISTGE